MKVQIFLALRAILLASCGAGNAPEATPTLGVDQIQTAAVATFSSALTLTAMAAPTNTATPTVQPSPTLSTPATTSAGGIPLTGTTPGTSAGVAGGVASTASYYGLTFVSDVSIPDNTQMDPGKSFTKTSVAATWGRGVVRGRDEAHLAAITGIPEALLIVLGLTSLIASVFWVFARVPRRERTMSVLSTIAGVAAGMTLYFLAGPHLLP